MTEGISHVLKPKCVTGTAQKDTMNPFSIPLQGFMVGQPTNECYPASDNKGW